MAVKIIRKIDPKKDVKIIKSGKYAQGSAALNAELEEGRSKAAVASRQSTPAPNTPVSSQYGGSNLGDKTTPLLGRAPAMYKSKVTVVRKKK